MTRKSKPLLLTLIGMAWLFSFVPMAAAGVVSAQFNGLTLGIDDASGNIVYLSSPATGAVLVASGRPAGLLDLAYPIDAFVPMRLASGFSKARITQTKESMTITWDALGASRADFPLPHGNVWAEVKIRAASDGRSVILTCHVENKSDAPIPQELFPDLRGLMPFAGLSQTELRLPREAVYPFTVPSRAPDADPAYYERVGWRYYNAGGYYDANALRWLDYGSHTGGLSVFQAKWGTDDRPNVFTDRTERDPSHLRLAWEHEKLIPPGQNWDSGEFWLTPHPGGWAKGIEVFRDYVNRVNPPRTLPKAIRNGLGYQTIWLIQATEHEVSQAAFRYQDIPRVAADAHKHGLDELVLWNWSNVNDVPVLERPELGTEQDFLNSVREANNLGEDVSAWVSIHIILNPHVARYGAKPGTDNWTYHRDLLPQFRPYYTHSVQGVYIGDDNSLWQRDVYDTLKQWIDRGVTSWSWDQFGYTFVPGQKPPLVDLIGRVRALARAKNPESTFGSESITGLEWDSPVLDYTWNWLDYEDAAPITSVLRSPRLNCNIEDSPLVVKKGFADDLFLNVWPSKPDEPNGTAVISDRPALSAALQQAAKLRKQFLPYFVDGTFIGDSVLIQPTKAFVRGYISANGFW